MRHSLATLATSLVLLTACSSTPDGPERPPAPDAFRDFEIRLLTANEIEVDYSIESSGAVASNFDGSLHVIGHDQASMQATGAFQGAERHIELTGDGNFLRGGSEAGQFEMPAPLALAEGLMIGCTRMGLLHNLAMLSNGAPPDGTDGNARTWTRLLNHAWVEGEEDAISFDIEVGEQPVGTGTLWFGEDGLPVRREQTVQFPGGSMQVAETYTAFRVR